MSKIPSVLWTCDQGLETGEKARARSNIGAAEALTTAQLAACNSGITSSKVSKLDDIVSFSTVSAGGNTLTAGAYNSTLTVIGGGDVTVSIENNSLKISSSASGVNDGLLKFTLNGEGSGTSTGFTANSLNGATFNIPAASYDTSTTPTTYRAGVMTGQDKERLDTFGAHSHGNLSYTGCITGNGSTPSLNDSIVISHGSNAELDIASTLAFNPSASVTEERNAVSIKGTWYKYQPDLKKLEVEHNTSDDSQDGSVCTGRDMYTRAYNAWNLGLTPYYYNDFHSPGDHGHGSRSMYQCNSVGSSYCSFSYLGVTSGNIYTTTCTYYNTGDVTSIDQHMYLPYSATMDAVDELINFRTFCVAIADIGGTTGAQTLTIRNTYVYRYDTNEIFKTLTDSTTLTDLVLKGITYTDDFTVIVSDGVSGPTAGLPTGLTNLDITRLCVSVPTSRFTMRIFNQRRPYTSVPGDDGDFELTLKPASSTQAYPKIYSTEGNSSNQANTFKVTIYANNGLAGATPGLVTAFTVTSTTMNYTYGTMPMVFVDLLGSHLFRT